MGRDDVYCEVYMIIKNNVKREISKDLKKQGYCLRFVSLLFNLIAMIINHLHICL